jgi:hypothetical protein
MYSSLYRMSHGSFSGVKPSAPFGDFLFFSLGTATTINYSSLSPLSQNIRTIASAETVIMIGWMVIVFAAVIAYVEPRFTALRNAKRLVVPIGIDPSKIESEIEDIRATRRNVQHKLQGFLWRKRRDQCQTNSSAYIGVSLPHWEGSISKVRYDIERPYIHITAQLDGERLKFSPQEVALSYGQVLGELPQLPDAAIERIRRRKGKSATKLIVKLKLGAKMPSDITYKFTGNYLHILLHGCRMADPRAVEFLVALSDINAVRLGGADNSIADAIARDTSESPTEASDVKTEGAKDVLTAETGSTAAVDRTGSESSKQPKKLLRIVREIRPSRFNRRVNTESNVQKIKVSEGSDSEASDGSLTIRSNNGGFKHYVANDRLSSAISGQRLITALCGWTWIPSDSQHNDDKFQKLPVCPDCERSYELLPDE